MAINKELLEILACPDCRAKVELRDDFIVCIGCRKRYPIRDNIPIMLINEALPPETAAKQEGQ